jgi:hypothetical protein
MKMMRFKMRIISHEINGREHQEQKMEEKMLQQNNDD